MTHDGLLPGDRVTWRSINGEPTGVVLAVDRSGALVRTDEGRHVILTTTESLTQKKKRQ